jgi:L-2,4-diaminobutyric acid acetyltransferase
MIFSGYGGFLSDSKHILLRQPVLEDGMAVWRLVGNCPPLDSNSSYCNLLQCHHFAGTSVVAESGDELMGFISGYRVPERLDTLFIWQVAVAKQARGLGMASRMLADILARPLCQEVRFLETTITPDNEGSWALFQGLARKMDAPCESAPWLDKDKHFEGLHDSETLVRIGPFTQLRETI